MSIARKKKEPEKSQEPTGILTGKQERRSRKKDPLKAQFGNETRADEAPKKIIEPSGDVEEIKEISGNTKKAEEPYSEQLRGIEQRINEITDYLSSLENKEKEKLGELEDIKQKKTNAETEKKDLLEKKNRISSSFEEMPKKDNTLLEDVKLPGEHDSTGQEPAIETGKQTSRTEDDLPETGDDNKTEERETDGIPKQAGVEAQKEGLTKEEIIRGIEKLEKRDDERIDDLKRALRITDKLIVQLPMNHKKQFCSSRTFEEYEKLHKIVFDYQGTPIQKKYLRENVKWILREVDTFLGKLPEGEIDNFLASSDFEQYNRILESYGIVSK
ncbi:MAG: hypothetical protein WAX07_09070 [Candidatus Altiarchaeia archaeon]